MLNSNNNTDDIFNAFFNQSFNYTSSHGGHGGAGAGGGHLNLAPIRRNLRVSLKDLYLGKTMAIKYY